MTLDPSVNVGDLVALPKRYGRLAGEEGEVVAIEDGWVLVDCGHWGVFGMPADQVRDPEDDGGVA